MSEQSSYTPAHTAFKIDPSSVRGYRVIYLSELIDAPIWDASAGKLGVIGDIAVDLREPLPRVTGLWIKGDRIRIAIIPWEAVAEIGPLGARLNLARYQLQPRPLQPDEFLLAETILDTQVVDTNGLKVMRVNDVQLKRANGDVRLIATDVGLTGRAAAAPAII